MFAHQDGQRPRNYENVLINFGEIKRSSEGLTSYLHIHFINI